MSEGENGLQYHPEILGLRESAFLSGYAPLYRQALDKMREVNHAHANRDHISQLGDSDLIHLERLIEEVRSPLDPHTRTHNRRTGHLSQSILTPMYDVEKDPSGMLYLFTGIAGELHDGGKSETPDDVLLHNGALSEQQWSTMIRHPEDGTRRILESEHFKAMSQEAKMQTIMCIVPAVAYHHVHYDGKGGYGVGTKNQELISIDNPIGSLNGFGTAYSKRNGARYGELLSGDNIPFIARLVAVADSLDAALSMRKYKQMLINPPKTPVEMRDELRALAGTVYDPHIAEVAANLIDASLKSVGERNFNIYGLMLNQSPELGVVARIVDAVEQQHQTITGNIGSIVDIFTRPDIQEFTGVSFEHNLGFRSSGQGAKTVDRQYVELSVDHSFAGVTQLLVRDLAESQGESTNSVAALSDAAGYIMRGLEHEEPRIQAKLALKNGRKFEINFRKPKKFDLGGLRDVEVSSSNVDGVEIIKLRAA